MPPDENPSADDRRIYRRTVVKVFAVQLVTLLLLWLLQRQFG
jgi:hypothetical protein